NLDELNLDELNLDELNLDELNLDELNLDELNLDELNTDLNRKTKIYDQEFKQKVVDAVNNGLKKKKL
ncbi:hypothetical protein, partial [Candidatus Rhabdochlamydia sp. W815]